ncbi:hypothetical protein [Planctomycetes bacterium TBK1r]|uniref:Uncharacterized protein n=1 Tax=Stieleria magnilauensis TaxID=2527963 RepID=A0ABX5XP47_9BACT|nr:hypothetical protein TBK1r_05880 [Planctomycetes bacterium TBK1r]
MRYGQSIYFLTTADGVKVRSYQPTMLERYELEQAGGQLVVYVAKLKNRAARLIVQDRDGEIDRIHAGEFLAKYGDKIGPKYRKIIGGLLCDT